MWVVNEGGGTLPGDSKRRKVAHRGGQRQIVYGIDGLVGAKDQAGAAEDVVLDAESVLDARSLDQG